MTSEIADCRAKQAQAAEAVRLLKACLSTHCQNIATFGPDSAEAAESAAASLDAQRSLDAATAAALEALATASTAVEFHAYKAVPLDLKLLADAAARTSRLADVARRCAQSIDTALKAPALKFSFESHYDDETLHVEGDCMPADLADIVDTARAALRGAR